MAALVFLALATSVAGCCRQSGPSPPTVTVGEATFEVEVAATPAERTQGLSGRGSLPPRNGMLFTYSSGAPTSIWMKGMLFPLDIIWIGNGCEVVDITLNTPVPPSGSDDSKLPRYRSAVQAANVLEINAGEVQLLGITVGDTVSFSGVAMEQAQC